MSTMTDRRSGLSSSLALKAPCRLATTANISLSGFITIDGVLPTATEHEVLRRILVKDQDEASENGIYLMSSGTWERAKDFDSVIDFVRGTRVYVWAGSVNAGYAFVVSTTIDPDSFEIDDDDISFASQVDESNITLAAAGIISFGSGDVTITHSTNALAFAGASNGYSFDDDILLPSGAVINFGSSDVTVTHSSSALAFAGAVAGYSFDALIKPSAAGGAALGSTALPWSAAYLSTGGFLDFGGVVRATHSSSALTFSGAGAGYSFDALIKPSAAGGAAIGSSALPWAGAYLATGGGLYYGGVLADLESITTVTALSTGTTAVSNRGIADVATAASSLYTMTGPPAAGVRKTFTATSSSTLVRQITSSAPIVCGASVGGTAGTLAGSSSYTVLTFNGRGQSIELLAMSTAYWQAVNINGFSTAATPLTS